MRATTFPSGNRSRYCGTRRCGMRHAQEAAPQCAVTPCRAQKAAAFGDVMVSASAHQCASFFPRPVLTCHSVCLATKTGPPASLGPNATAPPLRLRALLSSRHCGLALKPPMRPRALLPSHCGLTPLRRPCLTAASRHCAAPAASRAPILPPLRPRALRSSRYCGLALSHPARDRAFTAALRLFL